MKSAVSLDTKECSAEAFELVKKYISDFELDDRHLQQKEFVTLSDASGLLGFGRVREYDDFSEMCSLGILKTKRSKGIGKRVSLAMIKKAKKTIYLCCIIPSYFESLGFEICTKYPKEMQDKLDYCTNSLHVEEEYVVMKMRT